MGKSCRDMAEALRDCMLEQECMSDGKRTLKECLRDRQYAHECTVSTRSSMRPSRLAFSD